jgi:hypothetical protein
MNKQITAVWLLGVIITLCGCLPSKPQASQPEDTMPAEIKKGSDEDLILRWKIQAVTIADVEVGKTKFDKPSGKEWEKFKTGIRPGDELWYFCSPPETWQQLAGWRGYAIIRDGRVVDHYTTRVN